MCVFRFFAAFSSFCINILIIFSFIMVVGGFIYTAGRRRRAKTGSRKYTEYPTVSVIVPARNEENVIRATVLSLIDQDYPKDRYEIIVVNDNSSDGTGEVLRGMQDEFPDTALRVITTDEKTGGKGKSSVLNMAFEKSSAEFIAVYDADNTPEPDALRLLVEALMEDEKFSAVTGKFRTRNRKESLLTRLIDQETLIAQAVSQAGFWRHFKTGIIPGTNFVIRRSALEELGGWDVKALIEDTEMSFRLLAKGKLIKYIPEAVTWEQEPGRFRAWLRQRTRWARGNIILTAKSAPQLFKRCCYRFKVVELFMLSMYVMLFGGVVFSDIAFIGGLFGFFRFPSTGVFSAIYQISWITQIVLYLSVALIAILQEKEERNAASILLIPVMLLVYSRLWIVIIIRAVFKMIRDAAKHREASWDKTEHLAEKAFPEPAHSARK
ncbi:MAG: glycosyltransferase family 2 protein [Clostridia bacterium]|nr:glycosyltransferase family 2 protein [Clostridia bacterium]